MKKVLAWIGGGFIALIIIVAVAGGGKQDTNTGDTSGEVKATQAPEKKKVSSDEIYAAVQNGMTKEEVITLAQRNPDNCIDSDIAGLGTSSTCSYGSVSITFMNGRVQSKTRF